MTKPTSPSIEFSPSANGHSQSVSESVIAKSGDIQFFPTNTQRAVLRIAKKRAGIDCKRQCVDANYVSEKSTLLGNENKRREELHVIDLQLKQQELLIKQEEVKTKQKINLFWDLAIEKMSGSSSIATTMETATAMQHAMQCTALEATPVSMPVYDINEADIQFNDFIYDPHEIIEPNPIDDSVGVEVANDSFGEAASNVASNVVVVDEFIHQSPFRMENMYEEASGNESSTSSSLFDDEENDPTFKGEI